MAQDYDTDPAFPPLGARTDTGTLFGQTMGLAMAPTVSYFADVYPEAVWEAGGATTLFVAGFGAAGYATRRDLSALARVLLWALIALIAFGVLLIFVSIPSDSVLYAVFGLAIFAGLVMYDLQRLRVTNEIHSAPLLRPRSSSTSSTSSSSSSGSSVGGAVDGPHRATDDAPILMAGGMTHDDECD